MSRVIDQAQFLTDVATHEIEVVLESGMNRYMTFRRPGTYCMGFNITTWPGYLCFSGDMGTFVFSRLPDMFEFFRSSGHKSKDGPLEINLSYWAEKLQAVDRPSVGIDADGIKRYDPDKFKQHINERLQSFLAEHPMLELQSADLKQWVEENLIAAAGDGEHAAHEAARDFDYHGLRFDDFWEADCREYDVRFVWCCYALAWAIKKYDEWEKREE